MARNPYAKSAKLFNKAADLFLTRNGDAVYMSEGHIILKMHLAAYDAFFRPVSGQFIELADGEKASRRGNMAMPEKTPAAPDMGKIFEDATKDCFASVHVSPFLMEYSIDGKKKLLQRMFTGENYYVAINNDFWEVAEENGFTDFQNAGSSIKPILATSGHYNGIMILPIRADQQKIDSFINVTK